MTKECTTCKFEPEWNDDGDGECKKLPAFVKLVFSKFQTFNGYSVNVSGFRNNLTSEVEDCNLWEAK